MQDIHSTGTAPFAPFSADIHHLDHQDVQYIEKVRKTLVWWDRWRWIGMILHVGLLAALIWLADNFLSIMREAQAVFPGAIANLDAAIVGGVCAGMAFGFMFQSCVQGMITGISGLRSERLLVQYYDQFGPPELFEGIK